MTPLGIVSPAQAALAYGRVGAAEAGSPEAAAQSGGLQGFGAALDRAVQGVIDTGHEADAQARAAITGTANLTEVVAAVSRAGLALQATSAIRDRMVSAYQEIMRIPI